MDIGVIKFPLMSAANDEENAMLVVAADTARPEVALMLFISASVICTVIVTAFDVETMPPVS